MSLTYSNRSLSPIYVKFSGSAYEQLKEGYCLCYAIGSTETAGSYAGGGTATTAGETRSLTGSSREFVVQKPSITNIRYPAGVVMDGPNMTADANGNLMVQILPFTSKDVPGVEVMTDMSVTADDLLGLQPESYFARRGVLFGNPILRVSTTTTTPTATVPATCRGVWAPFVEPEELESQHFDYFNDFVVPTTLHNGLTAQANAPTTAAGIGGIVGCVTSNTTNTVGGLRTTSLPVTLAAGNACLIDGRIATAVGTALAGSVFFGCSAVTGAAQTMFADTTHAVAASQSFFGVVRVLGTSWAPVVGAAGTNVTSTVTQANADGTTGTTGTGFSTGTPIRWRLLYNGGTLSSGGTGRILVFYNDTLLCTLGSGSPSGAPTDIPTAAMYVHLCTKNVGAVETTCDIDYLRVRQVRSATSF